MYSPTIMVNYQWWFEVREVSLSHNKVSKGEATLISISDWQNMNARTFIDCGSSQIKLYKNESTDKSTLSFLCYFSDLERVMRASLVAQWLTVCLPMQGTRVRALVWEDPTCRGATRPVSHNYWACAFGACAPQQERPRQWEARALRWRVAPARHN